MHEIEKMRRYKGNTAAVGSLKTWLLARDSRRKLGNKVRALAAFFPTIRLFDAAHNLELAQIAGWNFCSLCSVSCFESSEIKKRRCAMPFAFEVNFALWIMIGCATAKAVQFVG
jgi:hypothetical protein